MKAIAPEVEGRIVGGPAVFAADQPEYQALPAWSTSAGVITRWRLSWRERIRVLLGGDLWLSVLTFGRPLQPLLPSTERDEVVDELRLWAAQIEPVGERNEDPDGEISRVCAAGWHSDCQPFGCGCGCHR